MSQSAMPPAGTRDFLPETVAQRNQVIQVVESVYQRYGFVPLETPAIENLSTLLGKYGEEGDQLIFRLMHRGDKLTRALERAAEQPITVADLGDLGLRYDLTVPLARVVARYGAQLPRFFRRYQIQPVWRADRPAKGRFREFYQCDADIVGSASMTVEAELLAAVTEIFSALGFRDIELKLNHRQLLFGLVQVAGVPPTLETDALTAMDKLDKIGPDGVAEELAARGISPEATAALAPVLRGELGQENEAILAGLAERLAGSGPAARGLADLREILALCERTVAGPALVIDPVLARGLSYYTGPIFEVCVKDLAGSLAGGGRYDELIGLFGGRPTPASGVALGLERILTVMAERQMFAESASGPRVLVTCWDAALAPDSLALAQEIRQSGLAVELYPEPAKLGKQLKYAAARQIPVAAILAPDELRRQALQLKDLRAGTQQEVSRDQAVAAILALLGGQ